MREYWSSSKLADRIRGTEKPFALGIEDWNRWETKAKSKHPIRYWIAEELFDWVQRVVFYIPNKIWDVKYYIVNRWVDQSHALVAHRKHIKPGKWCDLDNRILFCLFDELADYVEIEKANRNVDWYRENHKNPKWWQVGRWRTKTWRNPEAGLDYLRWESNLTDEGEPDHQAQGAVEIMELYNWWTTIYPNRPDPYEVSGWSKYCEERREAGDHFLEERTDEDRERVGVMLDMHTKIEQKYLDEEQEMLIRLIKVRGRLWT